MAANEPTVKNLADLYRLAPLDWDDVRRKAGDQPHPGTRDRWARPSHVLVVDQRCRRPPAHDGGRRLLGRRQLLLQRRTRSRKIRNIERDPRCAFGVAIHGYDVALEGRAVRVTDDGLLRRIAPVFADGGWAPTVADGGFTHEFSAPSAGPPPWYVYQFTPEEAYAVATKKPGGATRWTF